MKKVFLIASLVFVVTASLTSCCQTCTRSGWPTVTVCAKDYSTEADYQNQISGLEAVGYNCQ